MLQNFRNTIENALSCFNIYIYVGSSNVMLCNQLCETVKQTQVGEILLEVDEDSIEDFYSRYLQDFVQIVHTSTQRDSEYELRGCKVS